MMNLRTLITLLFLCTAFHHVSAFAAAATETGTALKADTLKTEPYSDAKTSGNLVKGDSVTIIAKQGAWLKVKTSKSTGWVRLLSIKRTNTSNNQAAGILNVATGRAGTGKIVATTGVRGLSEQELAAAKFNESEVKSLESYTQSSSQAQKFANAGGLKTTKVDELIIQGGK